MPERIPDDTLLKELHNLADELGTTPKVRDMRNQGAFSVTVYQERFGSWNDALAAAGFQPTTRGPDKIPVNVLLEELQRLADVLETTPTKSDMQDYGEYSANVYQDRFGSWNNAITAAGLSINSHQPAELSDDALVAELQRLTNEFESTPTMTDMCDHGKFSSSIYHIRFGSWNAALEAAKLSPNKRYPTEIDSPNGKDSGV